MYPPALRRALVAGLWEAEFTLETARKAVTRTDSAYIPGCLFRVVLLCAHALHGHARSKFIAAGLLLQPGQLAGGGGQQYAQRELARGGEVGDTQRVPDLGVEGVPAGLRRGPAGVHPVGVPVDPVDCDVVDAQPAAAVDPRPPPAGLGQRRVRTGHVLGEGPQRRHVQRSTLPLLCFATRLTRAGSRTPTGTRTILLDGPGRSVGGCPT